MATIRTWKPCLTEEETCEFWHDLKNENAIMNALPLELYKFGDEETDSLISQPTSDSLTMSKETDSPISKPKPYGGKILPRFIFKPTFLNRKSDRQDHVPFDTVSESDSIEGDIQLVSENELRDHPYQSVGKLYWIISTDLFYSSAFYIGKGKIMTVAHAFYDDTNNNPLNPRAAIFVPAMKDKSDYFGMLYGHYPITELTKHPQFNIHDGCFSYDIAIATIGTGWFSSNKLVHGLARVFLDTSLPCKHLFKRKVITSFGLKKIDLKLNIPRRDLTWMAVGYGWKKDGKADDGSDGGKMTKVVGTIVRGQSSHHQVVMDIQLRKGMSGGPWLLHSQCEYANGCQSGALFLSVSPYFSSKLFSDLNFLVPQVQ